jgi:hypothetical protein
MVQLARGLVVDTGFAIIYQVSPVVRLAHSLGAIATWERTTAVSGDKRAADR